jgi:hypothetical protein
MAKQTSQKEAMVGCLTGWSKKLEQCKISIVFTSINVTYCILAIKSLNDENSCITKR